MSEYTIDQIRAIDTAKSNVAIRMADVAAVSAIESGGSAIILRSGNRIDVTTPLPKVLGWIAAGSDTAWLLLRLLDEHYETGAGDDLHDIAPLTASQPVADLTARVDSLREILEGERETVARICLSALFGFEFTGESLCDNADRIFSQPSPRSVRAVAFADQLIGHFSAALFDLPPTNPADSAERAE